MTATQMTTQDCWRRRKDGKLFTVVFERNGRTQLKPAEAKNLKNTRWLDTDKLPELHEPADAPPPPTLAERIVAEIGMPERAKATVQVTIGFPLDVGYAGWALEALEFVRRYPGARWKWMDVPGNHRAKGEGWFALDVYAEISGVRLHLDGPGGWTQKEANALDQSFRAAREETAPPPVEPDHTCPRCTFGWSDDA